jgi:hypothetical protein
LTAWNRSFLRRYLDGVKGQEAGHAEALFPEYVDDPIGFVQDIILPFFPNVQIQPEQASVLEAIVEHDAIAIKKANGIGITAALAWALKWYLTTRPLSRVITTAATERQVVGQLWGEVHLWGKRVPMLNAGLDFQNAKLSIKGHEKYWFAIGFKAQDRADELESGKAEGWHSQGGLLYIMDEAAAIAPAVWKEATGSLTDPNAKLMASGVPKHTSGGLYDAFTKNRSTWKLFSFPSAKEDEHGALKSITPLVTQESIDRKVSDYGQDSAVVKNRVLAEFASDSAFGLFKLEWLQAAVQRWKDNIGKPLTGPRETALDVGAGGDESAIVSRAGYRVVKIVKQREPNIMVTCGQLQAEARANGNAYMAVEDPGVGKGVSGRLKELKIKFDRFEPGGKPIDPEGDEWGGWDDIEEKPLCLNRRAEGWLNLQKLFKDGLIEIPDDPNLIAQLLAMEYRYDSNQGRYKILDKDVIRKKLGGKSPNEADALMICFAPRPFVYGWSSGELQC